MITALEEGEGSASRPGRSLPPEKTRNPLYRRLGRPQGRPGQVRKISPPSGFDPRTVQPVASRYTDYAMYSTVCLCMTTLTEVSPYFFLSCKAKCQGKTRKDGARPALFLIFVLFYVFFVLCGSVHCLCVDVYCTAATVWLSNRS